jgi:hypothetical protein
MKNKLLALLVAWAFSTSIFAINTVDQVSEEYVKLVLALGEHDPAYVDAYYGPKEWQAMAKSKKIGLAKIIHRAKNLQDLLKDQPANDEMAKLRLDYLRVQLSALQARADMLSGHKKLNFDQQSLALYDTEAPHFDLSKFDKILQQLDKLLPGDEPLITKAKRFKDQFIIPKDKLSEVFDIAIKACRERTTVFIELLKNENFQLEFVTDKPWSGYNWYKGNAFSLIQVNIEHPIDISRAIDLGCHEGYPGHHTYNALLEANLVKKRGWQEFSVYPLFSPQSLIAEGSANYGIEMAFPGDEKINFEKQKLFPVAGIDPSLVDSYQEYTKLTAQLKYADNELARLYLNGQIDKTKAIKLIQKYTFVAAQKAAQRVDFWEIYGAYVINYNWGKELVKNWVESGSDQSPKGRWKRFAKLLSSPRLPSTLN